MKWASSQGNSPRLSIMGTKAQHNSTATFGRCFAIPWRDIQPRLDALCTLSFPGRLCRWAPVVGHGGTAKVTWAHTSSGCEHSLSNPLKDALCRSNSHQQDSQTGAGHTAKGKDPAETQRGESDWPLDRPAAQRLTTSALTAAMSVYALGAGITAAAGTRLALQSLLITGFG